ncbi:hypothetical protein HELRODRAFT_194654 [Helobdella robusta]|uniref:Replication factor Mcm10 C-terminal domain-containing protein n=1 Tax=Helobdella robusta TaxID=6412 RepID=T1FWA1_HELRO|nr:hypothetical protein HELRODRAFT_194654 [Helobdella robusta]ESN90223.1 hypothetical protein HELRODRAFT_194654 [Helobdella robusta]
MDENYLKQLDAIERIKQMGGLKKSNPNSVRRDRGSLDFQERIKMKLHCESQRHADTIGKKKNASSNDGPPMKKSRLSNSSDLNADDLEKVINSKSKYSALVDIQQEMKQNEYFNAMEKTEKMEQKMINIMQIEVRAVSCKQCKYTALTPSELCKSENHQLLFHKAIKRFFQCTACKQRCYSLDRLPLRACSNCGAESFERTGMMNEKKGPKLAHENLILRGEEMKYINS